MEAVERALDVVLPARCVACGRGEELFCAACRALLVPIRPPLCGRCGAPTAWPVERCAECSGRRIPFASARAAVAYEGPAPRLVAAWKERGVRRLAGTAAAVVVDAVALPDAEAIAFVPGDADRTLWRGQNTAAALARELASRWQLPVVRALARARSGPRQRGLSREARRANVRRSFRATAEVPRRVVLVDDVYTTGTTASATASELRRAGARAVHVVTFARALRLGV